MNQAEISTLEKGAEFWNTYLRSGSASRSLIPIVVIPIDENDDNAAAISLPIPDGEDEDLTGKTELAASVIYGYRNYRYNGGYAALIMVDRPEKPGVSWATGPILTLPKNGMEMNLSSTIAHELFHALGVASSAEYGDREGFPENLGYGFNSFGETLTKWDTLLRDTNDNPANPDQMIVTQGQLAVPEIDEYCNGEDGPCFVTNGNGVGAPQYPPEQEDWDTPANWGDTEDAATDYPTYGGVYLTGDNILEVLRSGVSDDIAGAVAIHTPTDEPDVTVPGLPVNTWEDDYNDDDHPEYGLHYNAEFSHIELQNSLMSHQNYRNWGTFMEAELALLQDLGYELDRRNFYGFSIYRDNMEGENKNSFYARENGQYVTGKPNMSPWGIGLHIYGSENNITQTADLLADGFSGIGVRVDGSKNTLTIDSDTKITANGEYGHGVLFSYGKKQKLVLRGSIEASGNQGKAVAFDFGDNMLSNATEYRGSYIRTKIGELSGDWVDIGLLNELNGELITYADITGSVTGSKAAVYIGPSAYVKNINIMSGASINGNIVSDWKPVTNEALLDAANAPASNMLMTALTFGYTPDGNGVKTAAPDASFNATVNGDVRGSESLNMSLKGGRLAVTGNIDVHSLATEADTILSLTVAGTAKTLPVVRADTITVNGTLAYTFDPLLSGLNTGDVLTVLNAETTLTWAETSESFSIESVLDYYKFDYVYNQTAGTLGLKVSSAQSKQAGTQSSHAITTSVIGAIGNKIMGRLSGSTASVRGNYYSGSVVKGHSGGDVFEESSIWGKALYTHAHKSGDNAFKADIYGGVIGLDGELSDEVTLGIAAAYSKTDGEAGQTDAAANTYAAYLYGKYEQTERLSYNLAAGYGVSRFDVDNTPRFDVQFANVQGYVDYDLGKGFTAEGGVRYVFAHQDEYKTGTTTFNAEDTDTLTGVLGGRYTYNTRRFGIQMNLAAIYDFISDKSAFRATNNGASLYVAGERLHRFGGEAGIAATFRTGAWEFELGYDAQVRKDYNDQTVSLKAGYRF